MRRIMLASVLSVLIAGHTLAQDLTGKAKEAETLAAQGKFVEALAAIDEAATVLWDKAPLGFRRALWVAEPPGGFGVFNPRENHIYSGGAAMIIYVEPVGFGWRRAGDMWRTDLAIDIDIKDKAGKVVVHKEEFQKLQLTSRLRNREFMAHLTLTLTGFPKGEFMLDTTFRDLVGGKRGSFTLPFVIR